MSSVDAKVSVQGGQPQTSVEHVMVCVAGQEICTLCNRPKVITKGAVYCAECVKVYTSIMPRLYCAKCSGDVRWLWASMWECKSCRNRMLETHLGRE